MSFEPITPATHRGFILNKLVRNRPLLHAIELGGKVHAHYATGRPKIMEGASKLREEVAESVQATSKENLLEELGDVLDTIILMERYVGPTDLSRLIPETLALEEIDARLRGIEEGTLLESMSDGSLSLYMRKLHGSLIRYMEINLMKDIAPDQLAASRATKEAKSGKLDGLFAEHVFLPIHNPAANRWMTYFIDKFEQLEDFNYANPETVLTASAILNRDYLIRHPQG